MRKKIILIIISAILISFVALVIKNYNKESSFKYLKQQVLSITKNEEKILEKNSEEEKIARDNSLLKVKNSELFLGEKNAPVTMIEYASFSCPHCAMFYREAFDKIKADYIDTGKLKFIYRDFPLNQPALVASMALACRAQDETENATEKHYALIKSFFKTQDSWAFDQKYIEKLESITRLDGMSPDRFKSCLEDEKIQNKILQDRMESSKLLQLHSTPTFFINEEALEGYIDYLTIKKIIDKKLSELNK